MSPAHLFSVPRCQRCGLLHGDGLDLTVFITCEAALAEQKRLDTLKKQVRDARHAAFKAQHPDGWYWVRRAQDPDHWVVLELEGTSWQDHHESDYSETGDRKVSAEFDSLDFEDQNVEVVGPLVQPHDPAPPKTP